MHCIRLRLLKTPLRLWIMYLSGFLTVGTLIQLTAVYTRVARFAHDWQVLTFYGLYLVPLSILVRGMAWHKQVAYSLMGIAPADLLGFALQTSIAYPNNAIEAVVGERNFTLALVLIAAWMPFCGNFIVDGLTDKLTGREKKHIPLNSGDDNLGDARKRMTGHVS